jgi:hypothetical protein
LQVAVEIYIKYGSNAYLISVSSYILNSKITFTRELGCEP